MRLVVVMMAPVGHIFSLNVMPVISGAEFLLLASVVNLGRLVLAVKTRNLADDDKPLK